MTTNAESQKNTSVNDANRGRRWYSVFHSQSGQSLVELALITPLLLVVILGIIEMGRYAYLSILVGNAAETGAEFAAQNLNNAGQISGTTPYVQDAALLDFQNGTSLSGLVVTPTYACYCDSGGSTTLEDCFAASAPTCPSGAHWFVAEQVIASGKFNSLFSWPGIPNPLTITRIVTMRVKNQ